MIESAFLTTARVQQAFDGLCPEIENTIKTNPGRKALCLYVFDPCATPARISHPKFLWAGIAGEQDPRNWEGKTFADNARKKAEIAWRTGMSVHAMKRDCPSLFEAGDFKYAGGVVVNGIVVGASGLSVEQDIHFATELAKACDAIVRLALDEEMKKSSLHILREPNP